MTVEAKPESPSPIGGARRVSRPSALSIVGLVFVGLIALVLLRNFIADPRGVHQHHADRIHDRLRVYAIVALGYTLVYGILQLINFAHGDVFALSGLFASTVMIRLLNLSGDEAVLATILGIGATLLIVGAFAATLNVSIEFIAYRRLRNQPRLTMLISAVGMSFIVQNISLYFYGVGFYRGSRRPDPDRAGLHDRRHLARLEQGRDRPDHRPRCCSCSPGSSARRSRGRECARWPRTRMRPR